MWQGLLGAGAVIVAMAVLRDGLMAHVPLPVGYGVPLVFLAYFRCRRLLWASAIIFAILTIVKFTYLISHTTEAQRDTNILDGLMVLADLFIISAMVHAWITLRVELERRHVELQATIDDVAAREEEIARQNEELQSQTEELERQGEELRVTNEELARREKMLEALLDLARSLRADLPRSDTMTRICEGLGRLVGGASAAILQKKSDHVAILCHHGFGPDGPEQESIPYNRSFAALILERGRTGYLEDVSLRPDIDIPQPRSGPRHQSILASPLIVGGKVFGSLEIYGKDKSGWSDEQVALVESLAAQASTSLEAADLFEQIERERARLSAVLATAPLGLSICNSELTDIRVNPYAAVLFGVPHDANLAAPEYRDRVRFYRGGQVVSPDQYLIARALRGQAVSAEEVEVVAANRRLVLHASAAPIRDRDGKIAGAVAAFSDITARKQAERDLDTRRREAEESSVRKTRFLAAVSHDIRTPANAISLLAELIQRTATTPELSGEVPQLAKELKSSSLLLVNLVSDVLDVTRLDSGKVELTETEFSFSQLLEEECAQLMPLARQKDLEFNCETVAAPMYIHADRVKLGRVLGNLIGNAIKFTERGKITVRGEVNSDVLIVVSDTGPGIPTESQDRIFDEFFQLRSKQYTRESGSGLGLTISRRLVEAMGGKLMVHSTVGQGSTFTVTLPGSILVSTPRVG
jgi:signal transduction histidine kinase